MVEKESDAKRVRMGVWKLVWKLLEEKLDPVGDKKLKAIEQDIREGKFSSIHRS